MTVLFDVIDLVSSDGIVRVVALALPAAVFVTLLVLLRVKSKKKSRTRNASPARAVAPEAPSVPPAHLSVAGHADAALLKLSPVAGRHAPAAAVATPAHYGPAAHAPAAHAPTALAHPPSAHVTHGLSRPVERSPAAELPPQPVNLEPGLRPIEALKIQLSDAAATGPKTALAPLYLELAKQCRNAGDEAACLAALRSAAGNGALHGPRAVHAAARIELAEVALNSGDAIGACEQWQIARLVLHEEGLKDAYGRIDKRMRENGCPTDWVLTDF